VNAADNGLNMANRATVNHCSAGPPDTAVHQQRPSAPATSIVRADVTFKRLPFYDVLAEIMKPSTLGLTHTSP